jgi:hypothetical protein
VLFLATVCNSSRQEKEEDEQQQHKQTTNQQQASDRSSKVSRKVFFCSFFVARKHFSPIPTKEP